MYNNEWNRREQVRKQIESVQTSVINKEGENEMIESTEKRLCFVSVANNIEGEDRKVPV